MLNILTAMALYSFFFHFNFPSPLHVHWEFFLCSNKNFRDIDLSHSLVFKHLSSFRLHLSCKKCIIVDFQLPDTPLLGYLFERKREREKERETNNKQAAYKIQIHFLMHILLKRIHMHIKMRKDLRLFI